MVERRLRRAHLRDLFWVGCLVLGCTSACGSGTSSEDPDGAAGSGADTGGQMGTGGASATGGSTSGAGSGGSVSPTGGSESGGTAMGGFPSGGRTGSGGRANTGGNVSTGGRSNTGGEPNTGGRADTGGSANTGGNAGTGGNASTGGNTNTGGSSQQTDGLPWLHVEGNAIKNPAGQTVILRGVSMIDLGTTERQYGGARQMIDRLTDKNDSDGGVTGWYTTVIRIAVYPADSPDVRSPSTFQAGSDSFYNELLRPVVDRCKEKGVYAIIDWHYIADTTEHRQTTEQFWRYISAKFADDPHVLFELFNEPINDGDWTSVRADMQSWYDVVREAAPENLVLVGTPNWCQIIGPTADDPLDGTNIAYVAHMYPMHWKSEDLKNQITTAAAKHPVFMSEWGFQPDAPGDSSGIVDGTATSYGNPFKEFVEQNKTSWTAWCASYDWFPSMFNRDWTLRTGENGMGGFVKQWLYDKRDSDLPGGS